MRKLVIALLAISLLSAQAFAEGRRKGLNHSDSGQQNENATKRNAAAEKAYKAALDKIPDKKISDPWANLR
jgi:hypothetical protein